MKKINHSVFGLGEVVKEEGSGRSKYLTVRFENGKECRFAVPESFELGIIEVYDDSLKNDIDNTIKTKVDNERKRTEENNKIKAVIDEYTKPPVKCSKRNSITYLPIVKDFEQYLLKKGYSYQSDSGNPSTIYEYTKAVDSIVHEEDINWNDLVNHLDVLIPEYDVGGSKEDFGAKSNKTVINALKRFAEFAA